MEYFSRCHDLYQALNDQPSLEVTRVHYGMAQVHHKMAAFSASIGGRGGETMQLMRWKAQRTPLGTQLAPPTDYHHDNSSHGDDSSHSDSTHDDEGKSQAQETKFSSDDT